MSDEFGGYFSLILPASITSALGSSDEVVVFHWFQEREMDWKKGNKRGKEGRKPRE